jgi:hypothetical protein
MDSCYQQWSDFDAVNEAPEQRIEPAPPGSACRSCAVDSCVRGLDTKANHDRGCLMAGLRSMARRLYARACSARADSVGFP